MECPLSCCTAQWEPSIDSFDVCCSRINQMVHFKNTSTQGGPESRTSFQANNNKDLALDPSPLQAHYNHQGCLCSRDVEVSHVGTLQRCRIVKESLPMPSMCSSTGQCLFGWLVERDFNVLGVIYGEKECVCAEWCMRNKLLNTK